MKAIRNIFICAVFLLLAVAASAGSAWAATAANTQIVNTATLSFSGGTITASATVSVALVDAAPTVTLSDGNVAYTGVNTPAINDTLVLTSNANGPATYHVTAAIGSGTEAPVNTTGASVSDGGGFDVILGASVTTDGATVHNSTTTLVIPAPDAAHIGGTGPSSYIVNGIGPGSAIIINSLPNSVASIALNADGNYTLTLSTALGAAVGTGIPVFEQKTFAGPAAPVITALPGTVVALGFDIHVFAQATVTNSTFTTTSNGGLWVDNVWTTVAASATLLKFVRNVTTPVAGAFPLRSFTINSVASDFYPNGPANQPSGVTGKPGEVLEYVLLAGNTSTTTDLNNCAILDIIPTAYVTFLTGGAAGGYAGANNDVFYSPDGAAGAFLTAGPAGSNQAFIAPWPIVIPNPASTTLKVNVGTGANSTTTGTIVREAVAGTPTNAFIAYRVTIK